MSTFKNMWFDIYYKGELIAERVPTEDRHSTILEKLGDDAYKAEPGDIEFRLVDHEQ